MKVPHPFELQLYLLKSMHPDLLPASPLLSLLNVVAFDISVFYYVKICDTI